MIGFTRFRGTSTLILGLALLCIPTFLQAQTAEERARAQELRQMMEKRLQSVQEERLVRIEEALARAKEQMAQAELSHGEFDEARLRQLEEMLAQVKARTEQASMIQEEALARQFHAQAENLARVEEAQARYQEEALARQFHAQAENLARAEEAQARYQEVAARQKVRAEEAMARAQEQVRKAQQVVVRVKSRVRLGVSLDGTQGEEMDAQGARIETVMDDTPAQEVGLLEGDIITHLNGHNLLEPLSREDEEELDEEGSLPVQRLIALAQELEAGDEVELRYLRDGQSQIVSFEAAEIDDPSFTVLRGNLGEAEGYYRFDPEERGVWSFTLPDREEFEFKFQELEKLEELEDLKLEFKDFFVDAPNFRLRAFPEGEIRGRAARGGDAPFVYSIMGGMARFGLELTELNPGLAEYFSSDEGLLVLDVEEDSTLGLLPGDVILAIDGRDIENQRDVHRILGSYEDEETVSFTLVRKGQEITVEGTVG